MTKITKATFKSFIVKNAANLKIKNISHFDGMTDGIESVDSPIFRDACFTDRHAGYSYGIDGVWLVNGSRNYFQQYNKDGFEGIEVSNCCGRFIVAIPQEQQVS